ncbi:MAG TPA: sucrase/ferredoxin-like family protein [Candidatus Aquicultoraceae bacterium]|nr:sucrase/ferredoxin-like family protein [Candidatus Aquicultoraceae bacterium]
MKVSVRRGEWPLANTVKPYFRHLLACTGTTDWPPRIEEAEGLLGRMARDIRDLRETLPAPPKLTATDESGEGPGLDLLVYPDAVRYYHVDEETWPVILREHVVGGKIAAGVRTSSLERQAVFVCVHGARDERCGCRGPAILEAFRATCRGLGLDVPVRATSHVGGHKYAGNVIVYQDGVWYGYVRPEDAPSIVREHLIGGRTIRPLLRGRMEGRA